MGDCELTKRSACDARKSTRDKEKEQKASSEKQKAENNNSLLNQELTWSSGSGRSPSMAMRSSKPFTPTKAVRVEPQRTRTLSMTIQILKPGIGEASASAVKKLFV